MEFDPNMSVDEYLAHYGIPKMKWGVRRYQNEDGSLTEEGKIRYGQKNKPKLFSLNPKVTTMENAVKAEEAKETDLSKEEIMKSGDAKLILKNMDKLTDSELQAAYNRANTVRNLQNLMPSDAKKKNPNVFQRGLKTITDAMVAELASEVTATAKLGVKSVGEKIINGVFAEDASNRNAMLKAIGSKTDSEKAEEARVKEIKNLIQTGNKTDILKNANRMTNQELAEAAKRMQNLNNIAAGSKDVTVEELLEALKKEQ